MLVPLADELSFAEGAAISCGTGTAYLALRRLASPAATRWRSSGRARWVSARTLLAKAMGARVIAVDMSPERLQLAKEFGADVTLNAEGRRSGRRRSAT